MLMTKWYPKKSMLFSRICSGMDVRDWYCRESSKMNIALLLAAHASGDVRSMNFWLPDLGSNQGPTD